MISVVLQWCLKCVWKTKSRSIAKSCLSLRMCGRTACTLAPDQVSTACTYKDKCGIRRKPKWAKVSGRHDDYRPSPNIGPKSFTPVLVSPQKFDKEVPVDENDDRILCEMKWGLVPSWHKGSEESFKFNMINCRAETLFEKQSFKGPLERGQRCVVLAEGFYEWQATKSGKKQPFFLHVTSGDLDSCINEENGNQEKHLLKMAALYDKWYSPDSKDPLYTYTIITVAASEGLKWLHERMPAILETESEVCQWLDHGSIPATKAYHLLKSVTCLNWFPVSTLVSNVKNQSEDCMKKVDLDSVGKDTQTSAGSKLMSGWLKKSPRKRDVGSIADEKSKKNKLE